jgi:hypothetical protein
MTTKEKAKELVEKFKKVELYHSMEPTDFDCRIEDITSSSYTAKQCALVAVEEIYKLSLKLGFYLITDEDKEMYYSFWEDVREEIEKL